MIENYLINEENLKKVYNDYRNSKGLEPVNFDSNPNDPVILQHCVDFLLKCVRVKPKEVIEDGYAGMLWEGLGVNSHEKTKKFKDEL